MRWLTFLLFLLAIDVYAFQAFRWWAQAWSSTARFCLYTAYWMVPALALTYVLLAQWYPLHTWPKGLMITSRALLFIAYLSKFLIAGVLLIDDFRRLVMWGYQQLAAEKPVDLSRNRFLSSLALVMGGIPFATLTYGMLRNRYRYQLQHHKVPVTGLPAELNGLRIVQISDIHSGSFTEVEPVRRAVELINAQQPDLVFFTGDIVNNRADEMLPFVDVFNKIKARYGVFSIFGNHDYGDYVDWPDQAAKAANRALLEDIHRRLGWQLLLNENKLVDINGRSVAVIGVENYSALPRFARYGNLSEAYVGSESADLKILLSHDPTHWNAQVIENFSDIALTLSGHTHGMQFGVEIPGWIRWSPAQYVYKQWAGLYQTGAQWLYVNRGLGFLGYPGRVGILPEITRLDIVYSATDDQLT